MLATFMFAGVWASEFAPDESQWIFTARYLTLFSKGIFNSTEWDSYWVHTQPPLARYVMGASLKARGYDLLALNSPWDFTKEPDENVAEGNMPTDDMLFWARLPMGIISAASVLLMYGIASRVGGPAAGLGAASWLALNSKARELMTRAEADGLLVFFILLGLLLTIILVQRLTPINKPAPLLTLISLAVFLSFAFGLGMASKLTATLSLAALPVALGAVLLFRKVRLRSWDWRGVPEAIVTTVVAGLLAFTIFSLLNPALYRSPLANSLQMFQFRANEMRDQMELYPTAALAPGLPRLWAGVQRPLLTHGVGVSLTVWLAGEDARGVGEVLPLDAILVALGLAASLWTLFASIRSPQYEQGAIFERQGEAAIVALVWTLIFFALIVVNMGLDWERYTLPLMAFSALWAGVAIGWLSSLLSHQWQSRAARITEA